MNFKNSTYHTYTTKLFTFFIDNKDAKYNILNFTYFGNRSRDDDNGADTVKAGRGWASSTNLSSVESAKKDVFSSGNNDNLRVCNNFEEGCSIF